MAARQRALCALFLAALLGQSLLAPSARAAFAARNEQVGYKACVHLMLRLIDCLLDASDLYLSERARDTDPAAKKPAAPIMSGPQTMPVGPQTTSDAGFVVGALGPSDTLEVPEKGPIGAPQPAPAEERLAAAGSKKQSQRGAAAPADQAAGLPAPKGKISSAGESEAATPRGEKELKGKKKEEKALAAELPEVAPKEPKEKKKEKVLLEEGQKPMRRTMSSSTTPKSFLDWLTGEDTCELGAAANEQSVQRNTAGCSVKSIKRLQSQLLDLRAQLTNSDKVSLAQVLRRFAELNKELKQNCPQPPEGQVLRLDSLSYTLEAVQVIAQMAESAQIQEGLEQAGDERAATETIKQHYAYLTQIITSYNLVFNAVDRDLMGPDRERNLGLDAVKRPDKAADKARPMAKPLLEARK